jgi:hypothetical protein
MKRNSFNSLFFVGLFLFPFSSSLYSLIPRQQKPFYGDKSKKAKTTKQTGNWLKNQPVEFLENKGQIMNSDNKPAKNVFFKAEAPGIDLYITQSGLSYVFTHLIEKEKSEKEIRREKSSGVTEEEKININYERIDLNLVGAQIKKENIIKEDTGIAYYNYLLGPGSQSIYHVKKYKKITIKNIYEGIDWVLYNSTSSGFKYDFIVHPGADAKQIELIYQSKKQLTIDAKGNLHLESATGEIQEKTPYSYIKETELAVESKFKLISNKKKSGVYENHFGFEISNFNASQTLVIDPILVWSTFYGGTNFEGTYCTDTDPSGNVFLCGYSMSTNFPLQTMGTFFQSTATSSGFIVKFNNTGTLLWSTFYGAAQTTYLATDNAGNLFLCGSASSTLFPSVNANTYFQTTSGGSGDAFIAKFDNLGNCTWATLYGGSSGENASSIATDQSGNVFLVGTTSSTNFPIQNAATYFEPTITGGGSGFIVKFDNLGNRLWGTYLKALQSPIICSDQIGNVYLTGGTNAVIPLFNPGGTSYYQGPLSSSQDGFVLKFDNNGNQLWGSYYGGSGNDGGTSLATDKFGNVFITGLTTSTNFPVQNAGTYFQGVLTGTMQDVFILKFDNSGTRQWASYIGGSRIDQHWENDNLTIDTCGNVFLGFTTQSRNLPFVQACDGGMFDNTLDTSVNANNYNVYLARFSNAGNLMWSSFFGGDGNSFRTTLDADRFGNVFFSGEWNGVTNASTYPLVYPPSPTYTQSFMGFEDLYVAKFTNNLANQSFSYTNLCANDTNGLPILAPGFLSGGTFSSSPGLSINPLTGQIITSVSATGNYTVSYNKIPCYCPGASPKSIGTASLSILTAPSISITGKSTICIGEKATYTASGSTSYTWNNGSNATTLSVIPTNTASIIYTLTSRATNGCLAKKTKTITVSKCTGMDEIEVGSTKLFIYPNPSSGEFTITSDRDIRFNLVNEIGQLIKQIELTSKNERKIEIQNLTNGSYFLIDTSSKKANSYKIVVTN